jgi:hypothetical protein
MKFEADAMLTSACGQPVFTNPSQLSSIEFAQFSEAPGEIAATLSSQSVLKRT